MYHLFLNILPERNDDVNGHYTCNSDGSIQYLEGFENPSNNCIIMLVYTHTHTLAQLLCYFFTFEVLSLK